MSLDTHAAYLPSRTHVAGFNVTSLIVAVVGAIILVAISREVPRTRRAV